MEYWFISQNSLKDRNNTRIRNTDRCMLGVSLLNKIRIEYWFTSQNLLKNRNNTRISNRGRCMWGCRCRCTRAVYTHWSLMLSLYCWRHHMILQKIFIEILWLKNFTLFCWIEYSWKNSPIKHYSFFYWVKFDTETTSKLNNA